MTRITGILIDTYGVLSTISIDGTTSHTRLSGMYEQIGCRTVDVIGLEGRIDVWVDDEGLYMQEPNPTLTGMLRLTRPFQTHLSGAGLFLTTDEEGDTLPLTPEQIATVIGWWQVASGVPSAA
ncbi:DUF3846 domain-containing protein [Subtercola boreus]|uniref:DUF3846 domain-containing protein n=1 Tax=Subtercola boreus TaxID=120213 RepID=A0A3E0W7I2_9MICO|nr:DUF3846 domain-containing protein [Subtercola boreus]RFA17845.1 hypothetical protein B7R23_16430 [Subtercola boreus]RFA24608.1 hypothetical protein B7R25_16450 [Subtercola boreus]